MSEVWVDIIGYEGHYKISNSGKVLSLKRKNVPSEKILNPSVGPTGYLYVRLLKKNKSKMFYVHRLVATHFVAGDISLTVNHIDGIKNNNHYSNLEWCTKGENNSHAHRTGLMNKQGEHCNFSVLRSEEVTAILKALENGEKGRDLAKQYNVSESNISLIKNRKNWKHL